MRARPVRYSVKLARRFCARLAAGGSRISLHRQAWTPSLGTVHNWLLEHDDFRRGYLAAFEQHALLVAEETVEIADQALGEGWATAPPGKPAITAREALMHARLKIDARNGRVGRLTPKVSGLRTPESKPMAYEDLLEFLD